MKAVDPNLCLRVWFYSPTEEGQSSSWLRKASTLLARLEPSIELGTAERSTIDVGSLSGFSRFRLLRIGYRDRGQVPLTCLQNCEPNAIGIVQMLKRDRELESSVYSNKRLTSSGYLLL